MITEEMLCVVVCISLCLTWWVYIKEEHSEKLDYMKETLECKEKYLELKEKYDRLKEKEEDAK